MSRMKTSLHALWEVVRGGVRNSPAATASSRIRQNSALSADVRAFLRRSYPSNHCYSIMGGQLRPTRQLAVRHKRLSRQYPSPLTSLLDLSCCKGYFVLAAARQAT